MEGQARFKVVKILQLEPNAEASVILNKSTTEISSKLALQVRDLAAELSETLKTLKLSAKLLAILKKSIDSTPDARLADLICSMLDLTWVERLEILEIWDDNQRLEKCASLIQRQLKILKINSNLQSFVTTKLEIKKREIALRNQLETIKKQLGNNADTDEDEMSVIRSNIDKLSPEATKIASRELKRLQRLNSDTAEYSIIRTYLEWLTGIPWASSTTDLKVDLAHARQVLDEDHHGLDVVKTRIIQYLAVLKLLGRTPTESKTLRGPILLLVGPPGCGKTSLGKSIASALGRKFHRISLGGVRDEAEIRGHRRTYVGAMPGVLIQAMRKVSVDNPVFLLDEIDKLSSSSMRGDPASALLEVLDPEQNFSFTDHYLAVPFNLSNVIFIATANETDTIPPALLDRMEVIRLPGYTFQEKAMIAKRFLIPKQVKAHGLPIIEFTDDAVNIVATGYTREAGVRNLEREISSVCRYLAQQYGQFLETNTAEKFESVVDTDLVKTILGRVNFEDEMMERSLGPGIAFGLAVSSAGGSILCIEAIQMPGTGLLKDR